MGYSCSAKASFTLGAIGALIAGATSNGMPDGGFYEIGREQADGAITGTVWKSVGNGHVTKRGGFKIGADGKVVRFPGLSANVLHLAETDGAAKYAAIYGTWQERGRALLADLHVDRVSAVSNWSWFESIFQGWQRENKIMFAVMPAVNREALIEALTGMLAAGA